MKRTPLTLHSDTRSKVPLMESHLVAIRAANQAGASPKIAGTFVVYDLPDRDCAAAASNGEYSIANGGVANYKAYVDAIRALIVAYSDVKIILIIGKNPCLGAIHQKTNSISRARFLGQPGHQHGRRQML
jgi:cellulase/cellobiase CelA1